MTGSTGWGAGEGAHGVPGDVSWYWIINIVALHTQWLHSFAAGYALWGGLVTLTLLLIVGWWTARRRPDAPVAVATAVLTGIAAAVVLLVNQRLLSPMLARPRPCEIFLQAEVLLRCGGGFAMPSGDCVLAGAFVAGLGLVHRGYAAVAAVVALALAFARVYVGVQYPFDTIIGLLLGALMGLVIVLGLRARATDLAYALTATRLRPLITTGPTQTHRAQPRGPGRGSERAAGGRGGTAAAPDGIVR